MTIDNLIAPTWPLDWCVGLHLGHEPDSPRILHNLRLTAAPRTPAEERDDPMGERAPVRVTGQALPALEELAAGDLAPLTICYPGPMTDRFQAQVIAVARDPADRRGLATVDLLVTSPIHRRL